MKTTLIGLAAAVCAILGLAGCGSGATTTANSTTVTKAPTPTADLPQLKVSFEVLNQQLTNALGAASASTAFQAQTLSNAKAAVFASRDAYLGSLGRHAGANRFVRRWFNLGERQRLRLVDEGKLGVCGTKDGRGVPLQPIADKCLVDAAEVNIVLEIAQLHRVPRLGRANNPSTRRRGPG
jgi:hypothetical protein